mgnify:FL=1
MTFTKNLKKESRSSYKKLRTLGLRAILIALTGLTSCETTSTPSVGNLNIYQPSTLRLEKGKAIQTIDGIYTPQTNEIWHSDARFRKLEREIYSSSK